MTKRITNFIQASTNTMLSLALLGILATAATVFADDNSHAHHNSPAKLVQVVRDATRAFANDQATLQQAMDLYSVA